MTMQARRIASSTSRHKVFIKRLLASILIVGSGCVIQLRLYPQENNTAATLLPNGWRISPAGVEIELPGDLPVRMTPSADRKNLFVVTSGYHHHSINVVDLRNRQVTQSLIAGQLSSGLALAGGGRELFVTSGLSSAETMSRLLKRVSPSSENETTWNGDILRFGFSGDRLRRESPFILPIEVGGERYMSGLVRSRGGFLYVANPDTNAIYKVSPNLKSVEASGRTGYAPMYLSLSPDEKELAVSNWGDQSVSLFDPETLKERDRIHVGAHPNDLVYARDGRLFVSNAGSNSVSVMRPGKVIETIRTTFSPGDPVGSTPDALAISPNGRWLFVANADNNDLAMVDISRPGASEILGFIPTGWFPSALAISGDNKEIYVGIGKGLAGPKANVPAKLPFPVKLLSEAAPFDFVGSQLSGYVEVIDMPTPERLAELTNQVRSNFPDPSQNIDKKQAELARTGIFPKIKHVVYIIRENRTYDQVLGDIGKGNSDPSLTLFGENVTPNAHELARKGALLDNIYVNGEVSQNGHQWSNAAYATEFTDRSWVHRYSGRRYLADKDDNGSKLEASPAGYLWDNCARHGLSYLSYGELAYVKSAPGERPVFAGASGLDGHYSKTWDQRVQELTRFYWSRPKDPKDRGPWYMKQDLSRFRDTAFAGFFIDDLHTAEKTGTWPAFMVMSLGEDHTVGLSPGNFAPRAAVGSNDQAVGQIIDAISHSVFWRDTAIFIIEDDAQDGPDHVDGRRTVGLVISPYTKKRFIDHTFYTTASMVRTMELILGLPPMTQFDSLATPMYNAFANEPDLTAYDNLPARIDLLARNPLTGPGATASLRLDFSGYDRADPDVLNQILWSALKPGIPFAAPVRSALPLR